MSSPQRKGGRGKNAKQRAEEEAAEAERVKKAAAQEEKLKKEEDDKIRRLTEMGLPLDLVGEPIASKEHLRKVEVVPRVFANSLQLGSERGNTRLMWAAGHGMQDHLELLLSQGVKVDEQNISGWTALFFACYNDRIECCRMLVAKGANVNIKAFDGTSPLMFAATAGKGNLRIVINLIEEGGANVNDVDAKGYTALMRAVKKNNVDIVKCLLEYPQTDLNIADRNGVTALMIAVNFGYLEIVQMLCSLPEIFPKEEDSKAKGGKEEEGGEKEKEKKKKKEKPKYIPGLQVNKADNDGYTALMYAAQTFHETTELIVECLLRMDNLLINHASKNFSSALTIAVKHANLTVATQLLQHDPPGAEDKPALRCDPNLFEPQRGTALIVCAIDFPELSSPDPATFWDLRLKIANLLVEHNASFYVTDIDELTVDQVAEKYGQTKLANWLRETRIEYDKRMG